MSIPVFVSYSHRNDQEKEALCGFLRSLPDVTLDVWSDKEIAPGDEWEKVIDAALDRAKVAVLLITTDFLNSQYVKSKELPRILQRQRVDNVRVVPVIARSCPWNLQKWLSSLQVLPAGGRPIWRDTSNSVDDTLNEVAQAIMELLVPQISKESPREVRPSIAESAAARVNPIVDGLDALTALRQVTDVAETIASFREDFRNARLRIEFVTYYKRLHDELHTIHTRCYRQLVDNARWFPAEASVCRSFIAVHADLQTSVLELNRIEKKAPPGVAAANWIRSIEEAAANLGTATGTASTAALNAAIAGLRRVLTQEPGRLDVNMNGAARDMNVKQLVRALRNVRHVLVRDSATAMLVDDFDTGLRNLEVLEGEWTILVELHRAWEEVEATLRLIDESIRTAGDGDMVADELRELRIQFNFLTEAIARLIASDDGDWLDSLRDEHEKLSDALARGDDAGARHRYMSFRSLTARRFENLDADLKGLCRDLSQLGKRLDVLAA
jgi:hypothetical protein